MVERYGVDHALCLSEFRDKFKETCLDRYGVDHAMQSDEIKRRQIDGNIRKYGVENYMQSEEGKEKFRNAILEKYGVSHPMQVAEIAAKQQKSAFKRKEFIMPSGRVIYVQGYEPQALNLLLEKYEEGDLVTEKVEIEKYVGKIWYKQSEKLHRYYPDIFVRSENLVVEVKSA